MMKEPQASSAKATEEADNEFEEYATAREDNSGNEADISEDDVDISDNDDEILVFDQSDDESVMPGLCHNNRVIMLEFREYLSLTTSSSLTNLVRARTLALPQSTGAFFSAASAYSLSIL